MTINGFILIMWTLLCAVPIYSFCSGGFGWQAGMIVVLWLFGVYCIRDVNCE